MGKSKDTFNKKEVRNKQLKKRKDKEKKRVERKETDKRSGFENMLAWVDENGNICSSPPDKSNKEEVKLEDIEISVPKGGSVKTSLKFRGKLNNYDSTKGFGFITCSNLDNSVFIHSNDCQCELTVGCKVEFETEMGPKGLKAINVVLIS